MLKKKSIFILLLLFITINGSVYFVRDYYANKIIDVVLKEKLNTLSTHYKILLETQKNIAAAIYESTSQLMPKVTAIFKEAKDASPMRQAQLRNKFHMLLVPKYKVFKKVGVYQYQFVFPNNVSFYRAHKPSKFGDDLTGIRADFEYTNRTLKPIRGFVQGRTAHGFRNSFPFFDKNHKHIGSMEVSFSSDSFQWYLNHISGIHSHFLVNKKIFHVKDWDRDDLVLKYIQSAENNNYMLTLGNIHTKEKCIYENSKKLAPIREQINANMLLEKAFSLYTQHEGHIDTISFLPINNIEKKVVAWVVSYKQSPIIASTQVLTFRIRIIVFILSLLIIYLIAKQISSNITLENKTKEQDAMLTLFNDGDFVLFRWNNDDIWSIDHVSDNVDRLLGYTKSEFLNNTITYTECVHKDDLRSVVKEVKQGSTHKDGYFEHKPYRVVTKNNSIKWVRDRTMIIKDVNDNITHYVGYISDITQMKEQHIMTEKKAYIDTLTNVYNRNKFDEIFTEEFKNVIRYNNPLSIAILDIDKFKDFNDRYGHLIGDEVLIIMAQTVKDSVRDTDTFARWGGEEFVIVFKNTPVNTAKEVAQKLKDKIQANKHQIAGKITASFGLTEYKEGDTPDSIFKRCDDALYIAKENGRNRVVVL